MGKVKDTKMQKPNHTPPKNAPRPVMLNPPAKKKTTGSGASVGGGPVMYTQKKPTEKKAVTPASTRTKRMQKPATKKQPVKSGRSIRGRTGRGRNMR